MSGVLITQEERAKFRRALAQIESLMTPLKAFIEKGTPIAAEVALILTEMTGSADPRNQLRALVHFHREMDKQYDEKLRYASQFKFSPFCEYMRRNEVPAQHQEFLIDYMERVHNREITRLAISLPPGSAKTTYASHRFPAWHLGLRPNDRWLQGAHTQTFAKDRLGKVVRGLMQEPRYLEVFPDMKLSQSSSAADYFEFSGGTGYYKAVGVGQGISGYRADIGGIDDPIASREDAESATIRRKLHEWYQDDFGTRPMPGSPIYVVACLTGDSRVHMADGTWKYLIDVVPGDRVVTYRDGRQASGEVTAFIPQQVDDIYELNTGTNTVRGNARHPILVQRPDGSLEWVRLAELLEGDAVVVTTATAFKTASVCSLRKTGEREMVYDLSVEGDENFVVDGVVVHNTRWHEDDLIGHELQKMAEGSGDTWEVINIPALAGDEDPLGREPGEGLWPEVFGKEFYEAKRRAMTGRSWNSLYQGNPVDEEGGVLKRTDVDPHRYKEPPKNEVRNGKIVKQVIRKITLSVDCAEKATQRSDWTAATVWAEDITGRHYLIHATRTRKEFVDMCKWIDDLAETFDVNAVIVEDRGAGTQYIQVKNKTPNIQHPVIAIATKQQSKEFRFDGVTPMFANGTARIPESGTDWLADVEGELFAFPAAKNDDYVDSVSQYLAWARERSSTRRGVRKMRGSSHH